MSAISRRHFIGSAAAASAIPLIGSSAHAQQTDWPNRQIKIIAGYPAGGQTDLFARTYGEYIRAETGQNVVGGKQGRRLRIGRRGRSQALRARRLHADVHDLDDDDHEPRPDQGHPLRRRKGFRARLDHAGGQPAVRGRREDRRQDARRIRRLREEGREGQHRHLRRRLLRAHGDRRNEQAVWSQDGGGALSRRSADVDRSCRRIHRRRPRQLWRGVARPAERPRPCGRRLAQAHVGIA